MHAHVLELNNICRQFPFKEKVVVVDSYAIGEQINEAFIKDGHQAINLKYKTVTDLARNLVELNSDYPLNELDTTVAVHFTYTLLKELKKQKKLNYFAGMEITPSFSHAIYSTIQTLRQAGYSSETLYIDDFITPGKAKDIVEILSGYENILNTHRFLDQAALLTKAIESAEEDEKAIFILQSNLHLSHLEEQFLSTVIPEASFKLPLTPVFGINMPERTSLRSISWGEPSPLSYLYQIEEATGPFPRLRIVTAKTEELEVKQILEQIKEDKAPLDESVVFYTTADSYITLFYHLTQKLTIPVTFGEGMPISFSRPGRLVSGLIGWIHSNYSVQTFLDLVNEGLINFADDAPSKSRIAKVLRDLQIGWSPSRYLTFLEMEIDRLGEKVEDNPSDQHRIKELSWLKQWFSAVFKKLPTFEVTINYKKCLKGITYFLKNYSKTSSVLDEISKAALLEEIEKIVPYADETLSNYDVFEKVKDLLLSLKVNQSRPKPGHLHITSFKQGTYNSRPNVFFVGLDNRKFPGNSNEDPLLLDTERITLGNSLPLQTEKGQENLYSLLQALAQSSGKITVSYCHFNINENRVVNPAHVILQCYRLISGNKDAEFKELKALPSSIIATDIFEDKDYWNEKLTADSPVKISDNLLNYFQNIKFGIAAEISRHTKSFSGYDGLVQIDSTQYDPRLNQEKTMSAGKLETLAKCPYSYFLKEVLRVRPIEEISFDANKWLDAATRGSLLHSIFETFYKQLKAENAKPSFAIHLNKILSIAKDLIEQQTEILPPPNERVYHREVNDILACCEIFLKEEELHGENYEPLHFEYSFGIDGKDPAIINLPSGEVKISGIIDRVDQSNNGAYHIIDYKTGSTYGYAKNEAFKGGRQLQHMIYALAIEQHLNLGAGAVEESTYYFPTKKGMALRFTRKQDNTLRTNGLDILEKLIDVIKHGHFEMTDNENDCKFCEFKLVCRRHFYDKHTLEMKQSNQKLKGVRAYD
jgi:ATP-dependent helicase/DNAse subunit B